ncbi:olfactory receptor 52N4-like [Chrysemys picta bellii]|uniref:olfactory receptor 52N4-like n=1 Tax=Chrysemys picta bellii TaxID=8478 RepID=UPI0032B290BA
MGHTKLSACKKVSLKKKQGALSISEPFTPIEQYTAGMNLTPSDPSTFILTGIYGLESAHEWISIPFSISYIIGLLGNFMLLFVVGKEQTLYKPMYLLFCMLALTDIVTYTSVVPKALCIFWFNLKDITVGGCLTQMFFLHTVSIMQSVAKMSCGDITVNKTYGLVIVFLVIGLDLMLIALSYGLIIRAIFRISSKKAHQKALSTCTAHICVMLMYYTPGLFSNLTHRFGQGIAPHIHIILSNLYLLLPPMLNPIIYGVKTKEVFDKVGKYICRS